MYKINDPHVCKQVLFYNEMFQSLGKYLYNETLLTFSYFDRTKLYLGQNLCLFHG